MIDVDAHAAHCRMANIIVLQYEHLTSEQLVKNFTLRTDHRFLLVIGYSSRSYIVADRVAIGDIVICTYSVLSSTVYPHTICLMQEWYCLDIRMRHNVTVLRSKVGPTRSYSYVTTRLASFHRMLIRIARSTYLNISEYRPSRTSIKEHCCRSDSATTGY